MSSSGVTSAERPTRSARPSRSASPARPVVICNDSPSPAESGSTSRRRVTAVLTAPRSAGSTARRFGCASQAAEVVPVKVRSKSAGSTTNGPYELPVGRSTAAGASRQYADPGSTGRQTPVTTTVPRAPVARSSSGTRSPTASPSAVATVSGTATCIGVRPAAGQAPSRRVAASASPSRVPMVAYASATVTVAGRLPVSWRPVPWRAAATPTVVGPSPLPSSARTASSRRVYSSAPRPAVPVMSRLVSSTGAAARTLRRPASRAWRLYSVSAVTKVVATRAATSAASSSPRASRARRRTSLTAAPSPRTG